MVIQAIGRLQFRGFRSSRGCNAELVMSVSGTMIDLVIEVEIINRVRRHLRVGHSKLPVHTAKYIKVTVISYSDNNNVVSRGKSTSRSLYNWGKGIRFSFQ